VIKKVHVRYEDLDSIRGTRFAFGTTIEKLSMQTCDENWKPELVSGDSGYSFKLVKIENMAFYWDTNAEMYGDKSHGELAVSFICV
jgi:vacuolar protein sorting-associated protein 13A/C